MRDSSAISALLTETPLFASLSQADSIDLSQRFHTKQYDKGQVILHHEDPGHNFFILTRGSVKVTRPLSTGAEAVINILYPGEFFGEMALLDGRPRSASVYALESTEVIVLYRSDFVDFLASHPDAAREIIVVLADRIRRLNDRIEDMMARDLPGRLARRLMEWVRKRGQKAPEGIKLHVPMTQSEMAGMVGASRQRLNGLLGQWQDKGIIRLGHRHELIILEPARLEKIGE